MKEINIKRKDRNIDVIKEKMLEILDEYEEAKEENNEDAMIKLEGYFNKQKALMEDSKEYFDSYDTDDIKMQANYDTDIDNVREAKYILAGKKGYEKNSDLYNDLMSSRTMEEAKEVLENKPEKKRKFVFRKFKKQFIAIGLVAALGLSALGFVSHLKNKKSEKSNITTEISTENKNDENDIISLKRLVEKANEKINISENNVVYSNNNVLVGKANEKTKNIGKNPMNFNNDNIFVDESYKNLNYTGNGETVSNYAQTNGVGTPGFAQTTITETLNENIILPSKPSDTVSTVILPEKPENNQTTGSVTEVPGNNDNNTNKDNTEKVTIDENEEVPNPSKNNPSEIEEDPSNNNGNDNNNNNNNSDNNESNTTEDVVIPPKPEENNPSKIEETGDDDIIYFDEHGNSYTIPNSPKSQETTEEKTTSSKVQETIENTKEEEKTTIEENEEVPSFETPTEIEEEKSSITEEKEQYIALREAITSALAQNNVETENMEESQVLTYRM